MTRAISGRFMLNPSLFICKISGPVFLFIRSGGSMVKKVSSSILAIRRISNGTISLNDLIVVQSPNITVAFSRLRTVNKVLRSVGFWVQVFKYSLIYSRTLFKYLYYSSSFSPSNTLFVLLISSMISPSFSSYRYQRLIFLILLICWNFSLST